jgi:hypothetical protein
MNDNDIFLVNEIRILLDGIHDIPTAIIKWHATYNVSIVILYIYKYSFYDDMNHVSIILYYDNKYDGVVVKHISDNYEHSLLMKKGCTEKNLHKVTYIKNDEFNQDEHITIYDYGKITDKNSFCNILKLFLIRPRNARPINRVDLVDIDVICKID